MGRLQIVLIFRKRGLGRVSRRDWSRVGVNGALNTVAIYSLCFPCVSLCHLALVEEFFGEPNTELDSSFMGPSPQGVPGADKINTSWCRHSCRCCL